MMNLVLHITYDGSNYLGWQKTNQDPLAPSVEFVLESVVQRVLQHEVSLQAASRTDRGVHAEGQVVNFVTTKESLDLAKFQHSLNCLLPQDIRVLQVEVAASSFHATLAARAKQYVYRLYTGPTMPPFLRTTHWHVPETLDLEKMLLAADILLGEHDFIALRNFRKGKDYNDTVRIVYNIDFERPEPNLLFIKITANNFLYKMARNIVGTLVYVGQNKFSPGHVQTILTHGKRAEAGITAPAHGLSLLKVFYAYPPELDLLSKPHAL
jgi:tRNA pseudouridine38-40 synthase